MESAQETAIFFRLSPASWTPFPPRPSPFGAPPMPSNSFSAPISSGSLLGPATEAAERENDTSGNAHPLRAVFLQSGSQEAFFLDHLAPFVAELARNGGKPFDDLTDAAEALCAAIQVAETAQAHALSLDDPAREMAYEWALAASAVFVASLQDLRWASSLNGFNGLASDLVLAAAKNLSAQQMPNRQIFDILSGLDTPLNQRNLNAKTLLRMIWNWVDRGLSQSQTFEADNLSIYGEARRRHLSFDVHREKNFHNPRRIWGKRFEKWSAGDAVQSLREGLSPMIAELLTQTMADATEELFENVHAASGARHEARLVKLATWVSENPGLDAKILGDAWARDALLVAHSFESWMDANEPPLPAPTFVSPANSSAHSVEGATVGQDSAGNPLRSLFSRWRESRPGKASREALAAESRALLAAEEERKGKEITDENLRVERIHHFEARGHMRSAMATWLLLDSEQLREQWGRSLEDKEIPSPLRDALALASEAVFRACADVCDSMGSEHNSSIVEKLREHEAGANSPMPGNFWEACRERGWAPVLASENWDKKTPRQVLQCLHLFKSQNTDPPLSAQLLNRAISESAAEPASWSAVFDFLQENAVSLKLTESEKTNLALRARILRDTAVGQWLTGQGLVHADFSETERVANSILGLFAQNSPSVAHRWSSALAPTRARWEFEQLQEELAAARINPSAKPAAHLAEAEALTSMPRRGQHRL